MYNPKFNSVLVEIDDKDADWGGENQEAMLGKSYSKGKVISVGEFIDTNDHPMLPDTKRGHITHLVGKDIMWNEGDEAGLTFEHEGKLYGFIYWWSIRGVKDAK